MPLETVQVEHTDIIYKAPHPILAKHWDKRCQQLLQYLAQQQDRLEEELPSEFQSLRSHLFVEAHLAYIIEANMKEVVEALAQIKLRLEKVQYAYQSL